MPVPYRYDGMDGKVAVVTGGSQNLGAAMATALADQGCTVAVVGRRNRQGAEAVAKRIVDAGGRAAAWCADLTKEEEVGSLFGEVVKTLGVVEILVNNAGGWIAPLKLWEQNLPDWRKVIQDNLDSVFLCTRAVAPGMIEKRWGRIVNLSSMAGRIGRVSGEAAYGASKGGIIALTRQLAVELGPHGVTVNAIAPGTTLKDAGETRRSEEYYAELIQTIPTRRLGTPADQAAVVCFLASPAASWVTGVTVDVDGGQTIVNGIAPR
ncbi:MAG: SDR family oxidoreductase [Chloroflexi bacterium]|nr:SDR family oxidoreductase [Chloroflexota bacterium]